MHVTDLRQNVSQNGQRFDDAPTVQTKAKMNHVLTRGSTADFGTDSMFESSRFVSKKLVLRYLTLSIDLERL